MEGFFQLLFLRTVAESLINAAVAKIHTCYFSEKLRWMLSLRITFDEKSINRSLNTRDWRWNLSSSLSTPQDHSIHSRTKISRYRTLFQTIINQIFQIEPFVVFFLNKLLNVAPKLIRFLCNPIWALVNLFDHQPSQTKMVNTLSFPPISNQFHWKKNQPQNCSKSPRRGGQL